MIEVKPISFKVGRCNEKIRKVKPVNIGIPSAEPSKVKVGNIESLYN